VGLSLVTCWSPLSWGRGGASGVRRYLPVCAGGVVLGPGVACLRSTRRTLRLGAAGGGSGAAPGCDGGGRFASGATAGGGVARPAPPRQPCVPAAVRLDRQQHRRAAATRSQQA